jgi:hypothetical protein
MLVIGIWYHGFVPILYGENEFPGKYHRRNLKNLCLVAVPMIDDSPFVLIKAEWLDRLLDIYTRE